jgi:hypothetical protein
MTTTQDSTRHVTFSKRRQSVAFTGTQNALSTSWMNKVNHRTGGVFGLG